MKLIRFAGRSTLASIRLKFTLAATISTAALLLSASFANASTITETISFQLAGFQDGVGNSTPPISSVDGSFTLTYDPSLSYSNDTADIFVKSLSGVGGDTPVGFNYSGGYLFIGDTLNGANGVTAGTNDFAVFLNVSNPSDPILVPCSAGLSCGSFSSSNQVLAAGYTTSGTGGLYLASVNDSSVSGSVAPEPSCIALFAAGLCAMVGVIKRRRSA